MRIKKDPFGNFISFFNSDNGFYFRTGIIERGKDTGKDPFRSEFPELIDIGIMGSCIHGGFGLCAKSGVQCYQNGLEVKKPNMSVEDFKKITDECKHKTFQFALGGRGDPDTHENIEDILKYSRDNDIVPNFTSSGFCFTESKMDMCKDYIGAVAISWYRNMYTIKAIENLVSKGITTNIHYVLGNNTIDEALEILDNSSRVPSGINAIIFLLHKPVGMGTSENVLSINDPKVREFFSIVDTKKFDFKIGFDSCSIPGIINLTNDIDSKSFDTCEGGRFSCYISSDMVMVPCSFDQDLKWGVSIKDKSIYDVWNKSVEFEDFRSQLRNSCPTCSNKELCFGGCPISKEIVLCNYIDKL